jgi:polyisoprenoid-binding protein YceI
MSALAQPTQQNTSWNLDPSHSDVQFSVRHLGLFSVKGHFETVAGSAKTEDGKLVDFEAVIDATSLNTRNKDRDGHLRSADFLDTEKFPEIRFKSTAIREVARNNYKASGDLTISGETHPVELDIEMSESIKDPWGLTRTAAQATTEISRKQWGLVYNQILETGGLAVGDEVKISIEVEAVAA